MSEILNQPVSTPCPAGWSKKHKWRFDSTRRRSFCCKCMMMLRIEDPDMSGYNLHIGHLHDKIDKLTKEYRDDYNARLQREAKGAD